MVLTTTAAQVRQKNPVVHGCPGTRKPATSTPPRETRGGDPGAAGARRRSRKRQLAEKPKKIPRARTLAPAGSMARRITAEAGVDVPASAVTPSTPTQTKLTET